MQIRNNFVFTLFMLMLVSCTNMKSGNDRLLSSLYELTSKCDKIVITFGKSPSIDTIITDTKRISWIRNVIIQSEKGDTCYHFTGSITFYQEEDSRGSIDFGINTNCPSYYVYIEGK